MDNSSIGSNNRSASVPPKLKALKTTVTNSPTINAKTFFDFLDSYAKPHKTSSFFRSNRDPKDLITMANKFTLPDPAAAEDPGTMPDAQQLRIATAITAGRFGDQIPEEVATKLVEILPFFTVLSAKTTIDTAIADRKLGDQPPEEGATTQGGTLASTVHPPLLASQDAPPNPLAASESLTATTEDHGLDNFVNRLGKAKMLVVGAGYSESERTRLCKFDPNYIGIGDGETDFVPGAFLNQDWDPEKNPEFNELVNDTLPYQKFESIRFDLSVQNLFTEVSERETWGNPKKYGVSNSKLDLLTILASKLKPGGTVFIQPNKEESGVIDTALQDFFNVFGIKTEEYKTPYHS